MKIGFIGLGIMGSRMAANLVNSGYDVAVYNRSREKADSLVELGASLWEHPSDDKKFDIVITMLADPSALENVAFGENGFLKSGHGLWIDCSTTNPTFVRGLAEEAEKNNVRFMDAPVAGSLAQAERAELVFLAGGDEADVAAAKPLFEAMGSRTAHIGDVGMGMSLKLVLNHLLACSMAAFGEALHLGMALGIEKESLLNTLIGGPVVPPYMQMKKDKLQSGEYAAEFPLRLIHKDMQMVSSAADEVSVPMPVANCVKDIFLSARNAGYEDADFSAIAAFLESR